MAELPEEIDGIPIRKPGSVYLPEPKGPVEGDEPIDVKLLVKVLSEKDDLERCVITATSLGGTSYFGLYKGDPVFTSEMDPIKFYNALMEARVGLKAVMLIKTYVNGFVDVQGIKPDWVVCSKCRQKVPYNESFSRVSDPVCDSCLQKQFELSVGEE